ncbi:class I SAM-dependent RNA methyltransferase [Microbacterium radiodurans]|uniref:Class I SAM-dependent RNA methyltransferase n=1 Tax=Microbacterium radiodurans TaxID=661398 RepID=A0A5J5INP6_9MICO|nr:TRAM domain-containing protein [Microbacterium radiodurans]KAA9085067.1 class I SAM-dependent RNA methyltransferase [Microbacterium radiodurans]
MHSSGETLDLDITDVAHGGVFVARHEGRVVFVPDAIPGERMRVRLSDTSKPSFWRAEALEVVDASPHRQAHVWDAADIERAPENRAGGADFGHIALAHQRELKRRVIRDALVRMGGLSGDAADVVVEPAGEAESADGTGWRTRVSLHVDADGRIGPYAARSHRVVEVASHPLATAAISDAATRSRSASPGRLDIVEPADGRVRILPRPESSGRTGRGRSARPAPVDPAVREVVVERAAGREFRVDVGGFWQVHRLAADAISGAVAQGLRAAGRDALDPDAWHLDLYGGVGLLAATLGDLGGPSTRVTSVEADARATDHAGENLAEWVGARAETARVDRWLGGLEQSASPSERARVRAGVVVLDPPRSGAGREVVDALVRLQPETIVYVACDPVALGRDLGRLRAGGYEPASLSGLDIFPNSHHVETVAVLTRGGSAVLG